MSVHLLSHYMKEKRPVKVFWKETAFVNFSAFSAFPPANVLTLRDYSATSFFVVCLTSLDSLPYAVGCGWDYFKIPSACTGEPF